MSSRRSNPLVAVSAGILYLGGEAITLGGKTINFSLEFTKDLLKIFGYGAAAAGGGITIKTLYDYFTNDIVKNIVHLPYTILNIFHSIFQFLMNLPNEIVNLIKILLNHIQTFFQIFLILILVGRFDWLLEDMYTLLGISLFLTYLTYR